MARRLFITLLLLAFLLAGVGLWIFWGASEPPLQRPGKATTSATRPTPATPSVVPRNNPTEAASQGANTPSDSAPNAPSVANANINPGQAEDSGTQGATPPPAPPPRGPRAGRPGSGEPPRRSIADILEGIDLSAPGARERAVADIQALEQERKLAGIARAKEIGLPLRVESPDGTIKEIAGVDENGQPVYFITHNVNAAISTAANLLQASPYSLNGSGLTLGLWDGGSARATHQEFGGRITVKDGAASADHATHVAGTMIAAGVVASAKGMATSANIASYDWTSDKSEMTAAAAIAATETNKVLLSNHSYGYISGWNYVNGGTPTRVWEWNGNGTTSTSTDTDFGLYNTYARDSDSLAFSAPYYLMFRSAGNDRTDNPVNGQTVALSVGSATVMAYDSTVYPQGDGTYRGGFDTIGFDAIAKNVITIGSSADAVTSGARDVAKANVSSFSCWGPTDDGRIKPDLVADGEGLYSSLNGSDTSYGTYSGTSMATPNASGTAALVVKEYINLFGAAMRSSTLKGLLIHTADDRGNAGPDYKYGWGLLNGKSAVDLVRDHNTYPLKTRINERQLTTSATTITHDFYWDGVSPIRVTLCWTDPAAGALTTSDSRSPRLVNNLDLKVTAPDGTQYLPYVMPFVDVWTQDAIDLPATTGLNKTDNVEQVYLATPTKAGIYRATVGFLGTLTNSKQDYSLLISGSANQQPPPPPLAVTAISPSSGMSGSTVTLSLTGASLSSATSVKLTRTGYADIAATNLAVSGESLGCQVNLTGVAAGSWNVVVASAGETSTLVNAFSVIGSLWAENFDGTATGWQSIATIGSSSWVLTTAQSQSPSSSFFAPAPAIKTTTVLESPPISIPAGATGMQLKFWHSYALESALDGGRLQLSADNGATWFWTDDTNSGVAFASNGYNGSIRSNAKSDFSGKPAWTGASNGFVETILNLSDNAKFAGKTVRLRWVLATNSSNRNTSTGWYVDSISLIGSGDFANQAPLISSVATSTSVETQTDPDSTLFYIIRGTSGGFTVGATDDGGDPSLTYTWSAQGPAGAPAVFFSPNGANTSKTTTAYFEEAGDYLVNVSVRDAQGLATSSSLNVRVLQISTRIVITPAQASVTYGNSQTFSASLVDQFDKPVAPQPSSFNWSASGGGSVTSGGVFTANNAGGPFTISALSATFSGSGSVTVNKATATVNLINLTQTYDGAAKAVTVTTDPVELAVATTYNGSPDAPVAAGSYLVQAAVTDPNYQGSAAGTLTISLSAFDAWRLTQFGTSWESDPNFAAEADSDGDGCSNLAEFYLGTDPNSPGSRLFAKLLSVDGATGEGTLEICPVVTTGTFRLQSTSSLLDGWSTGDVLPISSNAPSSTVIVPAANSTQFYRVVFEKP